MQPVARQPARKPGFLARPASCPGWHGPARRAGYGPPAQHTGGHGPARGKQAGPLAARNSGPSSTTSLPPPPPSSPPSFSTTPPQRLRTSPPSTPPSTPPSLHPLLQAPPPMLRRRHAAPRLSRSRLARSGAPFPADRLPLHHLTEPPPPSILPPSPHIRRPRLRPLSLAEQQIRPGEQQIRGSK